MSKITSSLGQCYGIMNTSTAPTASLLESGVVDVLTTDANHNTSVLVVISCIMSARFQDATSATQTGVTGQAVLQLISGAGLTEVLYLRVVGKVMQSQSVFSILSNAVG